MFVIIKLRFLLLCTALIRQVKICDFDRQFLSVSYLFRFAQNDTETSLSYIMLPWKPQFFDWNYYELLKPIFVNHSTLPLRNGEGLLHT